MVTIEKLEIQFDVEASDEQEMFRELFNRNIREWRQLQAEEDRIRRMIERDRGIGDRHNSEDM